MVRRRGQPAATRVGLWGAGNIAAGYAASCKILQWDVVSVASRTPQRAATTASLVNATPMTFDGLLKSDIDMVIVTTPPADHLTAVRALVDAEIPTLLCSPFGATLHEADELVSISEHSDVPVALAANQLVSPLTLAFLREVRALQTLTSLTGRTTRQVPTWGGYIDGSWGGGALTFGGTQLLASMIMSASLAGAGVPVAVTADFAWDESVEFGAKLSIEFSEGLTAGATIRWSRADSQSTWDLEASSATGVVRADVNPRPTLERDGSEVAIPSNSFAEGAQDYVQAGLVDVLRLFQSDVERGTEPPLTPAFARSVKEVVFAAASSAGSGGRPVSIPAEIDRRATALDTYRTALGGPSRQR